jgi:hypothetical protein
VTVQRLKKLQSELCEFIVHGRNQDRLVEQLRSASREQSMRRLDVYRNAYFIRLEAALAHDFPSCERVLGRAEFARQAGNYVVAQPSVSPSLRNLGDGFADWLRVHAAAVLADLADIEWAAMRIFDGPNAVPVNSDAMQAFTAEEWETLRVNLVPTLTLLSLTSNADEVWCDESDEIELKSAIAKSIAISRNGEFQPILTILDASVFAVLRALGKESSLSAVSVQLATTEEMEAVPELLAKSLLTAFSHGWVAGISTMKQEHEL